MSMRISIFSLSLMSRDSADHLRKLSSLQRCYFLFFWLCFTKLYAIVARHFNSFLVTLSVKKLNSLISLN